MSRAHAKVIVDRLLDGAALPVSPPGPCPYLPDRLARNQGFLAEHLAPDLYVELMDRRFRRSGRYFYRPACDGCQACIPLRIPIATFRPSRSQRRAWRRNADIRVETGLPHYTRGKWTLYARYLSWQHDTRTTAAEDLLEFLYSSPVDTREFCYWLGEVLVGVSIADQATDALSSVYMFFDPDHARRSLGTFSMLWEIDYCRRLGIPYYYLGYHVQDCTKMNYKADLRPHEILLADGRWTAPPRDSAADA